MRTSLCIAFVLLAACSKDDGTSVDELSRDKLVAAWKKGGLLPSPMTPATVAVGKDCQTGTVNSVDVLVCQYATVDEAKAAEPKGLEWVGSVTGMSQAAGKVLVAAADRRKADPDGKTINQLMKLSK